MQKCVAFTHAILTWLCTIISTCAGPHIDQLANRKTKSTAIPLDILPFLLSWANHHESNYLGSRQPKMYHPIVFRLTRCSGLEKRRQNGSATYWKHKWVGEEVHQICLDTIIYEVKRNRETQGRVLTRRNHVSLSNCSTPSSSLNIYPQPLIFHKSLKEEDTSLCKGKRVFSLKRLSTSMLRSTEQEHHSQNWANPLESSARKKMAPQPAPPGGTGACHWFYPESRLHQTAYPWDTLIQGKHAGMARRRNNVSFESFPALLENSFWAVHGPSCNTTIAYNFWAPSV